ncbi:PHO85 cyclin-1 [[Candida] jaroonii]|uniref:PHO85 cyclin-1 n=1 Tax=[Candida] jaroonii TaxID=467808 RepID=A0ACA9Y2I1_9ASCO|nr:PHO85 cyclin-1 [[Candida] jaroonii]
MESFESKSVEIFIKSKIDQDLVHKLIVKTLQIIPCPNETKEYIQENKKLPSLQKFLNRLIDCLNLNNGILMFTMIYLNRLKLKLPNNCKGLPSTRHRILLSCLILSIKFNNDFSLKNHDWLKLTNRLFNLKDINLMERQLLYLLNWNLVVSEQEILLNFNKFLTPIKESLINNYRMKQYLSQQKKSPKSPKKSSTELSPPTTPVSMISSRSRSPSPNYTPNSQDYSPKTPINTIKTNISSLNPTLNQEQSRKSSTSSISTISSVSSSSSFEYSSYGQNSFSSIDNLEISGKVNPIFELTALNEQYELNRLLESFNTNL